MKAKTARRELRRNQWKMAKAIVYGTTRKYLGIGKKWNYWVKEAMK